MAENQEKPAPPPPPPEAVLPALASFERGDWVAATAEGRRLLSDPDPLVQTAARDLLARMAPDPWAIRAGLLSLALLAIIAITYIR
jgi:hypothetical protein